MNFFDTARQLQEDPDHSARAHAHGKLAYVDTEKGDHTQAEKSHRVASIMHGVAANHLGLGGDEAKRSYHTIMAKHHEELQQHHRTSRTK